MTKYSVIECTNAMPDPENIVIELDIAFLSGLGAEIGVLPVVKAAILNFNIRLHNTVF